MLDRKIGMAGPKPESAAHIPAAGEAQIERERMGTPLSNIGAAYFFKRQFDEAAEKLLLAIQNDPGFPVSYRYPAACYAHMGRLDEARGSSPGWVPLPVRSCRVICLYASPRTANCSWSGLRLAAGETL